MANPCKFQIPGEDRWMTEDEFKQRLSEGLLDKFMVDNNLSFRGIKPDRALAESYGKTSGKPANKFSLSNDQKQAYEKLSTEDKKVVDELINDENYERSIGAAEAPASKEDELADEINKSAISFEDAINKALNLEPKVKVSENNEVFTFGGDKYNIDKANDLISKESLPTVDIPVDVLPKMSYSFINIDEKTVENADINQPVIIAKTKDGLLLIDGHHRVRKAILENKPIKGIVLDESQTKEIMEGAKTTAEKAKSMADAVRGMKLKPGWITGGDSGIAMSTFGADKAFEVAWNASLEVVAKIIDGGGSIYNAIQKGFEVMKESQWFTDLSKEQREQSIIDYSDAINSLFPKQPVSRSTTAAGKEFKGKVEEATGLAPEQKTVQMTPSEALKKQIRDLNRGGKMGQKALQDIKKEVRDYAQENLPPEKYSKSEVKGIMNAITNSTESNIDKVIDRIDKLVEKKEGQKVSREEKAAEAKRVQTARDIAKMVKDKRTLLTKVNNKWRGKATVESQKEFKEFVNSGALDNLDAKTQQELDAIKEVLDSIVDTGKADFKRLKEIQETQKRKENAELLEGLVAGTNIGRKEAEKIKPTILNGKEEVENFLSKGGSVIIDGQLHNKSSFNRLKYKSSGLSDLENFLSDERNSLNELAEKASKKARELLKSGVSLNSDAEYVDLSLDIDEKTLEIEFINDQIQDIKSRIEPLNERIKSLKSQNSELSKEALKMREDLISKGVDPKSSNEYNSLMDTIDSNNDLINDAKAEVKLEKRESESMAVNLDNTKGYKQRNMTLVKEAELPSNQSRWKRLKMGLNPINAINDVYSLLEKATAGNSKVRIFIKNNIAAPIQEAYVNRLEETAKKTNQYNDELAGIFGSEKKAVNRLSEAPKDLEVISDRAAQKVVTTNSHLVSYYNLSKIEAVEGKRSSGIDRLEKSGVDVKKVRDYIESNPDLKQYADLLMEKYNDFKSDYESVYELYSDMPLPEGTYYPEYASNYDEDFIDLDNVMDKDGNFDALSAVSNNMKQRTTFNGQYNLRMDAHRTMLDYIKNMEHARQFMPIAKSTNQLFNKQNAPYLVEALGAKNYNELREDMAVILSDQTPKSIVSEYSNAMNRVANLSVLGTLGFKPASIVKQFTAFTHFWTAGIKDGVDPISVIKGTIPKTADELDFFNYLRKSEYMKDRLKGGSIDIEMKRILDEASKSTEAKVWDGVMRAAMSPIRVGDAAAILYSPGGGTSFAIATYRKKIAEGMSKEQARDYAYKRFVTEAERTQQSTRSDITSSIQRDPIFRMMGMYRTGQMSMSKKVVNGARTLINANKMEKNEGLEARKKAISDDEIAQATVDIIYYSLFGSLAFAAVSSGAIKVLWDSGEYDEDDKKRMNYDLVMDQINSDLQGYGAMGFFADWALNTLRGDDWKNTIPALKSIKNIQEAVGITEAIGRDWNTIDQKKRKEFIKEGDFLNQEGVSNQWSVNEYEKLKNDWDNQFIWGRMTDAERQAAVKAIGFGNLRTTYNNFAEAIEGNKTWSDAFMNWEEDYFKISREKNKRDKLFERLYGEPYIKPEGYKQGPTRQYIPDFSIPGNGDLFKGIPMDESSDKAPQSESATEK